MKKVVSALSAALLVSSAACDRKGSNVVEPTAQPELLRAARVGATAPFVYVTNFGSSSVSVVKASKQAVVKSVPVLPGPFDVAISPSGRLAYVTTPGPGFQGGPAIVTVISTASKKVVATVDLGGNNTPLWVRVSPDGAFAYTGNVSNTLSVISTATNTLVATVDAGSSRGSCGGGGVAVSPDGAIAYMANECSATVSVISTATRSEIGFVNVGQIPLGVAITPDGRFVYVANESGSVSVIRTADNSVVATILMATPWNVTVTPDGRFAYVAQCCNSVTIVSTATNTVENSINVPNGSWNLAFTPDGAFAYVTSFVSNLVSVIATATDSIVGTIDVGSTSTGVAVK